MEFGPRALGARSIIGDARSPKMQSVMNLKIKFREIVPPVRARGAGRNASHEYFETATDEPSPYMLLVAPVREDGGRQLQRRVRASSQGIDKLNVPRSTCRPSRTSITRARIQTVSPDRHGRYYKLMKTFEEKTGCPVLINTSFNVRGEPIVLPPEDAYRCFMSDRTWTCWCWRTSSCSRRSSRKVGRSGEIPAQFQLD